MLLYLKLAVSKIPISVPTNQIIKSSVACIKLLISGNNVDGILSAWVDFCYHSDREMKL